MFNIYCPVVVILAKCKYQCRELSCRWVSALHVFMPVTSSEVGLHQIMYPQKCT